MLPRFDRKFAAQVVLAKHWRDATKEQRDRFIEAFYRALLRKYADGILEFDPDMIKVLPFRGDRITSYNVCYTKLLRVARSKSSLSMMRIWADTNQKKP